VPIDSLGGKKKKDTAIQPQPRKIIVHRGGNLTGEVKEKRSNFVDPRLTGWGGEQQRKKGGKTQPSQSP